MGGIAGTQPILADSGKSQGTNFFDDPKLAWIIAAAMIATILIAAVTGSLLPTLLRRMNIDPAIAGGVVLTTITDVAGFFIFLGLASWIYL